MSNNTNTLFWVITGAVIVLAVFLIINESQNNTLNNIFTKFNILYANNNNDPLDDDYSEYFKNESFINNNYTEISACGLRTEIVDGYKVGVHDFYNIDDQRSIVRWLIINTNELQSIGKIYISFLNCETDEVLIPAFWHLNGIQPNNPVILATSGGYIESDVQYYIKVRVEVS